MSFADEMNELGRKHQYAFDQKQVEACASEFYEIIQADLKADVVAGEFIRFGFFGQKKGVGWRYPCLSVHSTTRQTPYLTRDREGRTEVNFYNEKELDALLKRLKALGAADGIHVRFGGHDDNCYTSFEALFELR